VTAGNRQNMADTNSTKC